MLTKVKDSILFESFKDLCNFPLSGSSELFPREAVEKATEKSSWVLHYEAIDTEKTAKKLHFSELSCFQQSLKRPSQQT